MEVNIYHSHFAQAWAYLPLSSHSPSGTCPITCLTPPRGTPTEDLGRRRGRHTSIECQKHVWAPFIGLAQHALAGIATLSYAIWLAIPATSTHIGTFSSPKSWPLPCNYLTELPFSSLHTTCMSPSPSPPEELPTNGCNGKPSATPTSMVPHRLLLGGTFAPIRGS